MALTQAKWRAKLELIAPTWFFETQEEQDAHFKAAAKLLEQLDLDIDAHIANTFILQASDVNIDAQGDERSIIRLFGETDSVYALRVQILKNLSSCPDLNTLVDKLLIAGLTVKEGLLFMATFEGGLFQADFSKGSPTIDIGGVSVPTIVDFKGLKRVFIPFADGASFGFDSALNSAGNEGSLSFSFITNYIGNPTGNDRQIVKIAQDTHPITLTQKTNGDLDFSITTAAGTSVFTITTASFAKGRPNKIDITWKVDAAPNGLLYLLINGALQNGGNPFTFPTSTRLNEGVVAFGQAGLIGGSDIYIGDIESYSTLNRTVSYTPRFDYLVAFTSNGAAFSSNFNDNTFDADVAAGSAIATLGGTVIPTLVNKSGSLRVFLAGTGSGTTLVYPTLLNLIDNVATAKFIWMPNYNGSPTNERLIHRLGKFGGERYELFHLTNGDMRVRVVTAGGTTDFIINSLSAVLGREYEIALAINATIGEAYALIDGSLQTGAALSFTPSTIDFDGALTKIVFGQESLPGISNFFIDDIAIFHTVEHTADYTPGVVESDFTAELKISRFLSVPGVSVATFQEDDIAAIFMDRDAYMNRGFLLLLPVLYSFSIIVDKQIHAPYSFMDRAFHLNRGEFMGTIESDDLVFQLIQETVEINKAYGTLFRIVERVA